MLQIFDMTGKPGGLRNVSPRGDEVAHAEVPERDPLAGNRPAESSEFAAMLFEKGMLLPVGRLPIEIDEQLSPALVLMFERKGLFDELVGEERAIGGGIAL